jgi:Glycosyl hydrolase family 3 N terminal domain
MNPADELVVGLAGPKLFQREREWLQIHQPAGVILFRRNVASANQLTRLCMELHDILPAGAEIVADHEGGPVSVLEAAVGRPPAPFTLGTINDIGLSYDVFRDSGWLARSCGVDRLLAPCADVLSEPLNPVIGSRSFGVDPQLVARHVAAAVCGLRDSGLSVCLKHWPGHGGSRYDSHQDPITDTDVFHPEVFQAGLNAGADAVMVGHIMTRGAERPATLDSGQISALRGLCSRSVRLYADDITMGALRPFMALANLEPPGTGLVNPIDVSGEWIQAVSRCGMDRLLIRGIPWQAFPSRANADDDDGFFGEAYDQHLSGIEPHTFSCAVEVPESWRWARIRQTGGVTLAPDAAPIWLDLGMGQRWSGLTTQLMAELGFKPDVRHITDIDALQPDQDYTTLIISSHQPLPAATAKTLAARLMGKGLCITMGHPSLPAMLSGLMGSQWRVVPVYDVFDEDLRAFMA